MLTKADLLAEMNRDMPACVDWKAGARAYVASCFEKYGREPIERYSMNKPFSLMGEGADPRAIIAESVGYLRNLTNALAFLQLRGGSRILDVGCGGGWVSHSLSKMGCFHTVALSAAYSLAEAFLRMKTATDGVVLSARLPPGKALKIYASGSLAIYWLTIADNR